MHSQLVRIGFTFNELSTLNIQRTPSQGARDRSLTDFIAGLEKKDKTKQGTTLKFCGEHAHFYLALLINILFG